MIVDGAVQFHHQRLSGTIEVHDVSADTMLTAKLAAFELAALQIFP